MVNTQYKRIRITYMHNSKDKLTRVVKTPNFLFFLFRFIIKFDYNFAQNGAHPQGIEWTQRGDFPFV